MEMEVLGPLVDLSPGEDTSADITWAACRCPGPVIDVTEGGCTAERLQVERDADGWRARGTFGVFAPGRIELRAGSQVVLDRSATPLEAVRVDQAISLPENPPPELTLVSVDAVGAESALATSVVHSQRVRP
jgi:hypothetical protein